MDLNEPLASLTGTNDASALRVLARTSSELTGRRIAKLAEGNAASIRNALIRLAAVGLVHSRQEPHATYYSANRDHLLWPAIEIGLSARVRLEAEIAQFVREHEADVVTLALYGSVARGDARPGSDIDLLVVFANDERRDVRDTFINECQTYVHRLAGNPVQIYDLELDELHRHMAANDPIVVSWSHEAITLIGTPINTILQSA